MNRRDFMAGALFALTAPEAHAQNAGASQVIERLNAALLDVMRNAATLGYRGRAERLGPVLLDTYDIRQMAQTAAGRAWADATPEQQARMVELFGRFTIANYAARFDGYEGERFEITGEQAQGPNTLVQTRIIKASGEPVRLNYLMRQQGGRWRALDVFFNSTISEIAVRRSEFVSIIGRSGFDGLLASLAERVQRLEAGSAR